MKRLLLSILLVAMVSSAQAEEVYKDDTMTPLQFCSNTGQMANNIMVRRQNEESMTSIMLIIDNVEGASDALKKLVYEMTEDAFMSPIQNLTIQKRRIILRFRDKWEKGCINSTIFKP